MVPNTTQKDLRTLIHWSLFPFSDQSRHSLEGAAGLSPQHWAVESGLDAQEILNYKAWGEHPELQETLFSTEIDNQQYVREMKRNY